MVRRNAVRVWIFCLLPCVACVPSGGDARRCYAFDYTAQPEPGRRVWQTEGDGNWLEVYPSGRRTEHREVERPVENGCTYVVVSPVEDPSFRVRFPLTSCGDGMISFSRAGGSFQSLGPISPITCEGVGPADGGASSDAGAGTMDAGADDAGVGTDGGRPICTKLTCVQVTSTNRGTHCSNPNSMNVRYRNNCSFPVAVRYCLQRTAGNWECGVESNLASGVEGGLGAWICDATGMYDLYPIRNTDWVSSTCRLPPQP